MKAKVPQRYSYNDGAKGWVVKSNTPLALKIVISSAYVEQINGKAYRDGGPCYMTSMGYKIWESQERYYRDENLFYSHHHTQVSL